MPGKEQSAVYCHHLTRSQNLPSVRSFPTHPAPQPAEPSSDSQLSAAAYAVYAAWKPVSLEASIPWAPRTGGVDTVPAMQAVMKQAMVPAIRALMAPEAMSRFLDGAMDAGGERGV